MLKDFLATAACSFSRSAGSRNSICAMEPWVVLRDTSGVILYRQIEEIFSEHPYVNFPIQIHNKMGLFSSFLQQAGSQNGISILSWLDVYGKIAVIGEHRAVENAVDRVPLERAIGLPGCRQRIGLRVGGVYAG